MRIIKVSAETKKKAKELFEAGWDMKYIAAKLMLNVGNLYQISSKEKWQKGISKDLLYIEERKKDTAKLIKVRERIKDQYKEIAEKQREELKNPDADPKDLSAKAKAIADSYKLEKELYDITTSKEQLELKSMELLNEKLMRTLGYEEEKHELVKEKANSESREKIEKWLLNLDEDKLQEVLERLGYEEE